MNYVLVGINHESAPVSAREKLSPPPAAIPGLLAELNSDPSVVESAILSTCNRVEIYGVADDPARARDRLTGYFLRVSDAAITPETVYIKTDREAVNHLFTVTASLDSMIVGENQIVGQVKKAHDLASACLATGPLLNRLFNRALFVAKRVRTETRIGQGQVSVGSSAVALAGKIFGDLRECNVLLLGAGDIGTQVLKHLKRPPGGGRTFIVNRSTDKAMVLERQGLGEVRHFDDLELLLADTDILITTLAVENPAITAVMIERALARRHNEPLFIIDLGVPRNVTASAGQITNVYLYNIDELSLMAKANSSARLAETARARNIIAEEARLFYDDFLGRGAATTITGLSRKFEDIRRRECVRVFAKMGHLSNAERNHIEDLTRAILAKVLHDPIVHLKDDARLATGRVQTLLRTIFRLDDEVDDG